MKGGLEKLFLLGFADAACEDSVQRAWLGTPLGSAPVHIQSTRTDRHASAPTLDKQTRRGG
jgi:hypothetical protein